MPADTTRRVIASIIALKRGFHDRARRARERDPSSFMRLACLHYVMSAGMPLMKDVAGHLLITPPSATALINGLVQSGLIERRKDAADQRAVRLTVTAKGRAILRKGFRDMERHFAGVLSVLSAADQERLASLLERLASSH